ncbi:MAG TPA: hypothetical protein VMW69_10990, partial [Spirochaetia bacterium]|nr:hypothetical protein [Spirochaetia bacterium]
MPNLSDIQEFANELKRLGNEPEILRKRGEAVEAPSTAGESSETPAEVPETEASGGPFGGSSLDDALPPDIDQLLAGLGEEPFAGAADEGEAGPDETFPDAESPEAAQDTGVDEPQPSDDFLDAFLRESDQEEESELTSMGDLGEEESPLADVQEEAAGPPVDSFAEEPLPPDEGARSDELPEESLFFDIPSAEDLAPPEELPGGAAIATDDELELPDDLGFPGAETTGEETFPVEGQESPEDSGFDEPVAEELPESLGEEAAAEEGMPVDDFSFEDFESGIPDEPAKNEEGAGEVADESLEDFELPSFEESALGDESPSEIDQPDFGAFEEPHADDAGQDGLPEPSELGLPEEALFDESGFEVPDEASFDETPPPSDGETLSDEGIAPPPPSASAPADDLDDLRLGDIGAEFGLGDMDEVGVSEEELNPALAVGAASTLPPEIGAEAPEAGETPSVRISERDFQKIQETLSSLPLNLRLAVEELIGEQDLAGKQLSELVGSLVRGAPPRDIADVTGRILGRKIQIPVSYAKKTGLEFEEERATFAYRFRHNILPILRVFLASAAALALIIFLGYRFVYQPIHAYSLYSAGYGQLKDDNFVTANEDFGNASRIWQMKNWYYRYAEGYIGKKQYSFAADKYDSLLKVWPGDRKGIFDYAAMESKTLGNYQKANQLLDIILNENMWDYQGLLAAGDNYLAWGQEDPSKFELARQDYAMLLQHYGTNNEVLFRMLRYFIFTDNLKQVELLKTQFQADPRITVDPLAYAELGGYLIAKNQLGDVHDILFRAMKVDPNLPEIHYNLARYFKRIGDSTEESVALQKALTDLQKASPLTRRRLGMLIDTYDRIGENLYGQKSYLDAEQAYLKGISRYETALKQNQLKASPEFGMLYANLGDLNYYVSGNFDQALSLYLKAESNGYKTPELRYREGYVYYRNQDYQNAMLKFYNAAGNFSDNQDLLYATANTLYKRNDYFAAEGYYINL